MMARLVAVPVFADAALDVVDARLCPLPQVKSESSFACKLLLAAHQAIRPGTSCGTYQEYCQLVPSVMSPPSP